MSYSIFSEATFAIGKKIDKFHELIKYYFFKQKFGFSDTSPGKKNIKDWYAKFRLGEMSTETIFTVDAQKRWLPTKTSKKSTK